MHTLKRFAAVAVAAASLVACSGHGVTAHGSASPTLPDPYLPPPDLMHVNTCAEYEALSEADRLRLLPAILERGWFMGGGAYPSTVINPATLDKAQLERIAAKIDTACEANPPTTQLGFVVMKLDTQGDLRP